MTTDTFKVTIHMVSSLDGIIAKKDSSVSWFETSGYYEKGIEMTEQDTGHRILYVVFLPDSLSNYANKISAGYRPGSSLNATKSTSI